ncbi:hypothetical protein PRVXT_002599 [Proteinivorax tanatarense]|uniref:Uncharacterized protein n=1 Tax=Proteinivorax tanatarense TaxID=1260629 RepID=A0AAU7VKI1_9FIRM
MQKAIWTLGYVILVVMCLILYTAGLYAAFAANHFFTSSVLTIAIVGIIYAMKKEISLNLVSNYETTKFDVNDFYNFLSIVIGAVITYFLSVELQLGAVVAAGAVGVLAALVVPKLGAPLYTGAFVGMASEALLSSYISIIVAGAIAGIVFVISKIVFNGFGGKFGTIAFTGCIVTGLLTGQEFLSAEIPNVDMMVKIIICSVFAGVITYAISHRLGHGPVMASGIVGLIAGLVLPAAFPESGGSLAVMAICASFAGMAGKHRIPNEKYLALAALVSALAFIYTNPYMGGAGGKLGTIAFGSVIAVRGVSDIFANLSKTEGKKEVSQSS